MELDLADVNYLAVIAAIAVNMIVGAVWYSPLLFARPWMAANGFTEEQIKAQGSATRGYIVSVIASVVIAFAIALFAQAAGAGAAIDGLLLGLAAGVGFVATTSVTNYIFESRPLKLYLINAGYPVVSFTLIGLLIGAWQ